MRDALGVSACAGAGAARERHARGAPVYSEKVEVPMKWKTGLPW
jgi:hypothetical protein